MKFLISLLLIILAGVFFYLGMQSNVSILFIIFGFLVIAIVTMLSPKKKAPPDIIPAERVEKYQQLINEEKFRDINQISMVVKLTFQRTLLELSAMLQLGYFEGATIDETSGKILFPEPALTNEEITQELKTVMQCPNCGASKAVVIGERIECSYCGSPINLKEY